MCFRWMLAQVVVLARLQSGIMVSMLCAIVSHVVPPPAVASCDAFTLTLRM